MILEIPHPILIFDGLFTSHLVLTRTWTPVFRDIDRFSIFPVHPRQMLAEKTGSRAKPMNTTRFADRHFLLVFLELVHVSQEVSFWRGPVTMTCELRSVIVHAVEVHVGFAKEIKLCICKLGESLTELLSHADGIVLC